MIMEGLVSLENAIIDPCGIGLVWFMLWVNKLYYMYGRLGRDREVQFEV